MKIQVGTRVADIDLKPGVYCPWFDSAVGKTYLYRLLLAAKDGGYNVGAFTYIGEDTADITFSKLKNKSYDAVILDRYSLYNDDRISNILNDLGCPVIIDLKTYDNLGLVGCMDCEMEILENGVRVYVDDI